jgi:proline iminopeptidase
MADTSREGFIDVSGRKIWFRRDGSGKPGIPLLILHGGPGFTHDYLLSLEPLSRDRPVIW